MTRMPYIAAAITLWLYGSLSATTFYVDPSHGAADGDGSEAHPWHTLAEVIDRGQLTAIHPGDTILLATGYHGDVTFSGENSEMITIAAGENQRPTLSQLTIPSGKNWTVRGLVISPSFAAAGYKGSVVSLGDRGPSSNLVLENCYIFTAEDVSGWTAEQWMNANSAVNAGRHGTHLVVRNNYITHVRFGITMNAPDSLCEGNVVTDYSADGIRVTRDNITVQYNIIKNVYVSAADGDANHDDGIQCFLFNKGTGTVRNVKTIGNIIIAHEDPDQPLPNSLQGIGYFDGPLVDFIVTDNVINVDAWHGIALYDAQNALVERNVVWAPPSQRTTPWIMFGAKHQQAKDNTAKNNYARRFRLDQHGTVSQNNQPSTEAIYRQALDRAYQTICEKFGEKIAASDHPRLAGR